MSFRFPKVRLVLAGACALSALVAPPWVPFVMALMLAVRYRAWELVVIGAVMDLMWLPQSAGVSTIPYATLTALVLIVVFEPLRRELLIHSA